MVIGYSCTFKDDNLTSDCPVPKRKSQHLPIMLNKMLCTDLQLINSLSKEGEGLAFCKEVGTRTSKSLVKESTLKLISIYSKIRV